MLADTLEDSIHQSKSSLLRRLRIKVR